ncbi:putative glycolipid-binding domain-containing protein [Naasia sp. SYSU D00948]|uniref:putative glycolipid-binding domain-containing protein n=1 Tax=Naasia sp. SYSU D00948 TaxID=2817379 RepID=UPI001B30ADAF|nr:putative glycolipid-binding domain-containing protein [Naasia sp. SYSU D00948]
MHSSGGIRWRRLDAPGWEEARLERAPDGWRLWGELEFEEEGVPTRLTYRILCDRRWRTRSAAATGEVGGRPVELALTADGRGRWLRSGRSIPEVAGALDVDLSATPSTNTLAIRRLGLRVGESAPARAAWFRLPERRLEPLEQTYSREGEHLYRFDAVVDGQLFSAHLDTDARGWVVRYEGLWEAEERQDGPPVSLDHL